MNNNQRFLLQVTKPYLIKVFFAIILGFSGAIFNGVSTALVVPIVLNLVGQSIDIKSLPGIMRLFLHPFDGFTGDIRLVIMAIALIAAIVLKNLTTFLESATTASIIRAAASDMREAGMGLMMRVDLDFFTKNKVGDLYNRLGSEVQRVSTVIKYWIEIVICTISIFVFLAILVSISWQLTIMSTLLMSLVVLANRYSVRKAKVFGTQQSSVSREMSVRLLEIMNGIRLVKSKANEKQEYKRAVDIIRTKEKVDYHQHILSAVIGPIGEVLSIIILLLIIFLGRFFFASVLQSYSSVMLTYFVVLFRLLPFLNKLNNLRTQLSNISPSVDVVHDFLRSDNKPFMPVGTQPFAGLNSEIHFNDVSFSYPLQEEIVLKVINLRIPRGKTLALVGSSGSGKSTLADLLARFYDPTEGSILLDGIDLKEFDLATIRQSMGIVSQDTYLFNDSIASNIAYGHPHASHEDIILAAKRANAYEFIERLPQGFDTIVGDRGVLLSGGQRQRISIARALLQDPEILILDEATSALDTASEQLVQQAIEELSKDRTTLVIAHRLSTVQRAHQIAVLERGKVVEVGSHEVLLDHQGAYHRLYMMQFTHQQDDPFLKPSPDAQNRFSHELRTRLNTLVGSLTLLSDELVNLPEEQNELFEISFSSTIDLINTLEKYEQQASNYPPL